MKKSLIAVAVAAALPAAAFAQSNVTMYGIADAEYEWVDTTRYMGIFHEVPPATQALACLDCHGRGGRLTWKELGYDGDPLTHLMASSH